MHWHWQNLSAEDPGRDGSWPWRGRAWFHFENNRGFHVEWALGSTSCGAEIRFTPHDEEHVHGMLAFPPVAFYWGVAGSWKGWLRRTVERLAGGASDVRKQYGSRTIGLRVHDWSVWWDLWVDSEGGWTSKRPKWRDGSFNALNFLLGKPKYSSKELAAEEITVPMPEGVYRGTCKLTEDSWSRARWFTKRMRRAQVDMIDPIPFPGKGENSWDCGEDAMHGLSCQARSFADAIGACVTSVMRDRLRHGGKNWKPEAKKEAA